MKTSSLAVSMIVAVGLMSGVIETTFAQGYPQKTIKLVVPFPAGGSNDTAARVVARGLTITLGQSVMIENQGGAGGTIGAKQVATADPDGHTLLMVVPTNLFGTASLLYKLDYNPLQAFVPVGLVAVDYLVLAISPLVPAETIEKFVRYAKVNPGKLNYGSATGIAPHFLVELFKIKAGVNIVHVPYRGGAQMITDLLGGQIQMTVNGKSVLLPHIIDGKLRALAVTSAERWPELPNVPTLVEAGYADFFHETLFGIVAPAGTPRAVIGTLNNAINQVLNSSEVRRTFAKLGLEPKPGTPQDFSNIIAAEAPRWAEIVKITGVKLD